MPPKKENKAGGEEVEGEDPMVLQGNYIKFCKSVGLAAHTGIVKTLADEEKYPIEQIIVDDEYGLLGPGGARALMTSIASKVVAVLAMQRPRRGIERYCRGNETGRG